MHTADNQVLDKPYGAVGHYLLEALRRQGLNPSGLKDKLGVSTEVLNQLFYYGALPKIRQPKPKLLRQIAVLLNLDEKKLLRTAGYSLDTPTQTGNITDAATSNDSPEDQSEDEKMQESTTLGEYFSEILAARHISSNRLSELAGVSQGTIHNLLKQGKDASVPGPHPRVLRAICEVLGLDQLRVFQMAGYIDPSYRALRTGSSHIQQFIEKLEMLSPEQQRNFLTLLEQWQSHN